MGNDLVKLEIEFEGRPVTTFRYLERHAWVARQIGQALGYESDGRRLVQKVTTEWAEEAIEGHDFHVLRGEELSAFKQLAEVDTDSVLTLAPTLLILFEPGLHLILTKTRKPAGRRLRRLLADKVLPQLARDGRFDPTRAVDAQGMLQSARPALDREAQAARRLEYRKLAAQVALQTTQQALQQASSILYAADRLADPRAADAARLEAIRLLAGHPLEVLPSGAPCAPDTPPPPQMQTASAFPQQTAEDVEAARQRSLVRLANRQTPLGVQPPLPGIDP